MNNRRGIVAIGNLLVDQSLCCDEYPRESMLTMISDVGKSCGGGCTNVLFNLARMDPQLPLSLCGTVGKDELGSYILQQASQHQIDISRVKVSDCDATSFSNVMINRRNGYRTFFHYMGANRHLGLAEFNQLNSQACIAHIAYLLLLPELERQDNQFGTTGARAFHALQQQGFKVSLDLISTPDIERYQRWVLPVLPYVDYLVINDEEAKQLTSATLGPGNNYLRQAELLLANGVKEVVCIHYPQGATGITRRGERVAVASYRVDDREVVSTLGAGDAFCAGMLYGIHQGWELKTSLRLGCANAYFNLFNVSATEGAVSLAELTKFMKQRESQG